MFLVANIPTPVTIANDAHRIAVAIPTYLDHLNEIIYDVTTYCHCENMPTGQIR